MEAVVLSLRQTLACLVQLRYPRELGPEAFVLHVDEQGFLDVRRAGQMIPLRGAHVRHFFEEAGVELRPGQAIVLGPRLVRLAAEEALAEIGAEEARVRDQKLRLIDVSLAAQALEIGQAPIGHTHASDPAQGGGKTASGPPSVSRVRFA